jgi:Transglycosylase SLT domain
VLRSPKLLVGLAVGVVAALGAWTPAVSASTCVWQVKTAGGLEFNVPVGTPITSIVPPSLAVLSVTEVCSSGTTTTTTSGSTTTSSSSSSSSSSTTTSTTSTSSPPSGKSGGTEKTSTSPAPKSTKSKTPSKKKKSSKTTTTTTTTPSKTNGKSTKGEPSPSNPTYTLALPGAAPLGVPNFFIDSFQIPPFLLPIYQAAGIEYNVPWQVLASINQIETDYGRNLSVSSAGAVGWMQFLPSTWKEWGVDANGSGYADPYNPVDAIFTAARYLQAAGASKNLSKAIFAYNHASWYVQSVLLRAKLIGGMPNQLVGALTDLVEGRFPVAARATYEDDSVVKLSKTKVHTANASIPIESTAAKSTSIFAKQGSPVIAVNDGKILKIGQNKRLGRYIELQDSSGNVYTYANLGSIPAKYPVPKPVRVTAAQIAKQLSKAPATPTAPATAGSQTGTAVVSKTLRPVSDTTKRTTVTSTTRKAARPTQATAPGGVPKERLFAYPSRPASYAAGGNLQIRSESSQISSFQNYFSDVLHLGRSQYTLKPLKAGSIVVAGTILGRIASATSNKASHMAFMIQPAGKDAPAIDPKPILDGWKLLEATAVYRAANVDPFYGPGAKNPSIGQVLLMSKQQLTERVLSDPHVQVYACGRRDIQAGLVDRRILAALEFLSASGLDPSVSGLVCGAGKDGTDAAGKTGESVDISKINGIPIQGHQGSGSITDVTIRRLLTLQGAMAPNEIVSLMSYKSQSSTLALPDHANRIQITYTPIFGANKRLSAQITSILKPKQWIQLISRISQIPEPSVPTSPSQYAIKR